MPKFLIRILALVLVPCLMLDPVSAAGLSYSSDSRSIRSISVQPVFQGQALNAALVNFFVFVVFAIMYGLMRTGLVKFGYRGR